MNRPDAAREATDETGRTARDFTEGEPIRDTRAPDGPIEERWDLRRFAGRLVAPANRRKLSVIVVGTGLAGGSAAATLGELGYRVTSFCYQDSPRRAHSGDRPVGRRYDHLGAPFRDTRQQRIGVPACVGAEGGQDGAP